MSSLKEKVEAFLFNEAWLADSHAYMEWFDLWAEDCLYWIPCNDDVVDPDTHVNLIYETYEAIRDRVRRLSGTHVVAQQPRSRLCRVISNITVRQLPDGLIESRSVMDLTAYRSRTFEVFVGRITHKLRPAGESFKIVAKTVYLVNNDGYLANMTFIV
jgi:3-phenylpropionate/cinnamic acid dioxygenase small subunit